MKYFKIILSLLLIISIEFIFNSNVNADSLNNKTSIYMWEVDDINYSAYSDIINKLNINKIYAYVGTDNLDTRIDYEKQLLFEFANENNISTYLVYDENYEDQSENLFRIKEFIDEIKSYNETANYKIKGLTIDSEFHSLPIYSSLSTSERKSLFNSFVNAMKEAKEYANSFDLEYVVCIPVWLNNLDQDLLDALIKDGSDYVQLMNYTKNNMVNNIQEEVAIAKGYNKPIENIAEFQVPGPHEVTDAITFYNDGIDVANNKFKEIENNYNYSKLSFSYHYFKPILELMNNLYDYSNMYEYELYPKDINNNSLNVKNVYLKSNNDIINGIYIYNNASSEYIIHFYGLKYNEEYELVIDDNNYELLDKKTIKYSNGNRVLYDDAVFIEKEINNIAPETDDIGNIEENTNEDINEEIKNIENPQTGNNITFYILLYIVSIFGCICLTIYNFINSRKRFNK